MNTEKTPEQLMEDLRLGKPMYIDNTPTAPDFHTMALLAAQTIPNQTVGELLASADKIESWLMKPEEDTMCVFMKTGPCSAWLGKQKSPDNHVKASEDNDVFP